MTRPPEETGPDAVSELVGVLILTCIISMVIGTLAVVLVSQQRTDEIPALDISLREVGTTVYIIHRGGDTLPAGSYSFLINGAPTSCPPVSGNPESGPFAPGDIRSCNVSPATPLRVSLVGKTRSGTDILLFQFDREG